MGYANTKFKTEKRKANVGERILITKAMITYDGYKNGDVLTVGGYYEDSARHAVKSTVPDMISINHDEYEVIVETKPSKSERIALLESQVAELQAEVKALQKRRKPAVALTQAPTIHNITVNLGESTVKTAEQLAEVFRMFEATASSPTLTKSTPNESRKAVIERAKAFVVKNRPLDGRMIEFVINEDKRTVVALVHEIGFKFAKKIVTKAIAKCAPDDVFNADIGKAIALGRALGLDVSEFENAVKPTEFVKGHTFKTSYDLSDTNIGSVTDVKKADKHGLPIRFYHDIMGGYIPFDKAVILDDTEAQY